ncbi:hypothetical protein ACFFRR_011527 [Megaselia abdita]
MTRILTLLFCVFFGLQIEINAENLKIIEAYSFKPRDFRLRYGTVFTQISSETYADFNITKSNQCKPLTKYDLLDLEKRFAFFQINRFDVSELENNLNDIYEHFGVSRISYLPYNFEFQAFQRKDLDEAVKNSSKILTEITELNNEELSAKMNQTVLNSVFTKRKIMNKVIENKIPFDRIKKYVNFKTDVKIINSLKISFDVSYCVAELKMYTKVHKISYVPFELEKDHSIKSLKDQQFKYALETGSYQYIFLKDLNKECEVIGGILFCNIDYKKQIIEGQCLREVIKSLERQTCKISDNYTEFTDLGNGKYYFLLKNPSFYEYTCDGVTDKGKLREGFVKIGSNCVLSTAKTTVIGKNGFYKTIRINNDKLVAGEDVIPWDVIEETTETVFVLSMQVALGLVTLVILVFLTIYIFLKIRAYCLRSKKSEYDHLIDGMYYDS